MMIVKSNTTTLLLVFTTIFCCQISTIDAFDYSFDLDADEPPTMILTDVETGIKEIKTLFINEVHSVTIDGISWIANEGNVTGSDFLFWTTTVDDRITGTGNISLIDSGRILPTSIDAGTFIVTSNKKHTVIVTITVDESVLEVSGSYVAYRSGVSIIPMILVLVMAMTTQLVEISLFSCVFVGACIVAGNLMDGFKDSLSVYLVGALFDEDHVYVVLFTLFLSGMVGMIEKSGGMIGFTKFISRFAKSARSGQFAVYGVGCMIFFDDYANCLLAGETMKPLTDLLMVSREKLAFLVDATAAPVASISPVSSWVGFEIDLIQTQIDRIVEIVGEENVKINTSGLGVFLQSIRYRYYPILMIILLLFIIGFKRDFGPMLVAERKVTIYERTDGGDGKGKASSSDAHRANQPTKTTPLLAYNMLIPIAVLVVLIFYLLVKTGEDPTIENQTVLDKIETGNSYTALLWGTFGASVITLLFYIIQWYTPDGKLSYPSYKTFCRYLCLKHDVTHTNDDDDEDFHDDSAQPLISIPIAVDSFIHGMGRIFPALIILNLAWAVGSIMVDVGADRLFSRWIVGGINPESLPTLSFLISFLMALATGTSWGTMSILFPLLLVPTYISSDGDPLIFYSTTAGVLSGSVAGDHVSPISDTTVLSALACDCQLIRHVSTQSPYVAVIIIISVILGTVPVGYSAWPNIVSILLGTVATALFSYFICVPVSSPTGRYDILTQLELMIYKNPELIELQNDTKKYYAGESLIMKKVKNIDNEDEELLEEPPTTKDDVPEEGEPLNKFDVESEDIRA